ncbi:RES family NAD+ phosphorylase [Agrobacterium pusense]|uniref:RES family NAD+ phosphorylase n=1 Tax=Agrobacterium pusense TaxID=648995 RepID=UPI003D03FA2D
MKYQGKLYRALNPVYAREPLSGRGAELYGGRFNPKGMPALYTSVTVITALKEANQAGSLQPQLSSPTMRTSHRCLILAMKPCFMIMVLTLKLSAP